MLHKNAWQNEVKIYNFTIGILTYQHVNEGGIEEQTKLKSMKHCIEYETQSHNNGLKQGRKHVKWWKHKVEKSFLMI